MSKYVELSATDLRNTSVCSLSILTGQCAAGWYCSGGAALAWPNSTTGGGGQCATGFYCPAGSLAPVPCDPGKYCDSAGLAAPVGDCQAGFYCPNASRSSQNIICPKGHYCPAGSGLPQPCPTGTFSSATALRSQVSTQRIFKQHGGFLACLAALSRMSP